MADSRGDDAQLVERAVRDYFEGWYDADPVRMARALHPDLVKRSSVQGPDGGLGHITAAAMVEMTAAGHGVAEGAADRRVEVEVSDLHRDIACAVVHSAPYREYVHLVRTPEGWRIANTLYTAT